MRGTPGRRARFPIASLMALIALLAVEMAALRVASKGFVELSRFLTVAMLAVATYLARYRDGARAAGWFGFALFGWAYLVLAIDACARRHPSPFRPLSALPPVTSLALFLTDEPVTGNNVRSIELRWNQFDIFQSMLALSFAALGGLACGIWARRRGAPYREEESRTGKLELDDRVE
jgi:hypothetical protein